jgi:cytochrome P450 family 103
MAKPISEAPVLTDIGPDAVVDLHAAYREARAQSPVIRNQMGIATGLRARHMETILSDATRQMESETLMMQGVTSGPLWDLRQNAILFSNGDAHRRRRQPLARTFAFKLMEGMRPRATAVASELVQERLGAGEIDFLSEVSADIPARIIADVLGIPRSDLPYFKGLVEDAVQTLGFFDQTLRARYEANTVEFDAYVGKLIEDRRKTPRGDWLSEFAAAAKESGELSEAEIRTDVIALIVAGSDTTKNSIAMTLNLLLEHPDQWRALCADPDGHKKGACAEGLRYEPVALGVPRFSVSPFELDGYDITPGMLIFFSIVSACRDPDVYANPDAFDIARTDHPRWHFAFGGGAHRCLGEALARVEIEETLAAIARLAPKTRLAGPRPAMKAAPIRAVDQMRVAFA